MKPVALLAAAAAMFAVSPSSAMTTITFNSGSGVLPSNLFVFQDFESFAGGAPGASIGPNAFVFDNTVLHQGTRPKVGSTGNFAAVQSGGSFTASFSPTSVFAFVLGTLDGFNRLTLQYEGGGSQTYVGGQIIHDLAFKNNGQVHGQDNGVVIYTVTGGPRLVGAVFASSGKAFEFDNLAFAAVPEPATWAMLIGGFGLVGATSRRRRLRMLAA
jgi:hypothetical protein